jgi:RecJ-like exonuclease
MMSRKCPACEARGRLPMGEERCSVCGFTGEQTKWLDDFVNGLQPYRRHVDWDSIDHAADCIVWGNPADGGIDATLGLDAPCDCGAIAAVTASPPATR